MEVNRPFLNYQFTQTAYRNQTMPGSALLHGELPVLAGLSALVKERLRKRFDHTDDQVCDALLDEEDAKRAKADGHRNKMKRQMNLLDQNSLH